MLKLLKRYGKNKPAVLVRNKRYRARRAPRLAMAAATIASVLIQSEIIKCSNAHPVSKVIALSQHQIQSAKAVSAAMNFGRRKVVIKQLEQS